MSPPLRALALAALLLSACASENSAPTAVGPPAEPASTDTPPAIADGHEVMSNGGRFLVSFAPPPEALPMNRMFSLDVAVLDAGTGRPVGPGVEMEVDAAMPAHRHGMNTRPQVRRNPDGTFTAEGMLLHMAGDWVLYFDLVEGGVTERAQVDVSLE